jgi:propionyl-CoA synthetase
MDARSSRYHEIYARWQRDPEGFWGEAAAEIDWFEPPKAVFDPNAGIYGRWFVGGVTNTCFNAVDRQVNAGRGDQAAIIYDSPLAGTKRVLTYHRSSPRRRCWPRCCATSASLRAIASFFICRWCRKR